MGMKLDGVETRAESGDAAAARASSRSLERALADASAAQRRLEEAIEAIGEGFALWDADDRLILCNSRYHDFWQGLGDMVQPGVSYETLLREVAHLGLVEASQKNPERWIVECLIGHANPSGPYTHQFADGR